MKRAAKTKRIAERATQRAVLVPIERIVPGGLGLGHAERMTVMVPFTAPGETVRVAIDRVRGNTAFGSVVEVVEPGPARLEPRCPHFGYCGGCDFQHLAYEAQLEAKREIVLDCFRRIGGITLDPFEVVGSPKAYGYRTRVDWAVDLAQPALGYHKRASSEIFDATDCPILDPALDAARELLRQKLHADELAVDGDIQGAVSGEVVVTSPRLDEFPSGLLITEVNGERYGHDATTFFQANFSILPEFVRYVVEQATERNAHQAGEAIDLFSGVGLFTLPLARVFDHVTGVEGDARAGSYAHENAKAAGLTNVAISGLPVEQWVRRRGAKMERPSVVVLDPPRAGLEPPVVASLIAMGCERLVYVSCDPATLARDVKAFMEGGYMVDAVRVFDMFPQTRHVETVVTLILAGEE